VPESILSSDFSSLVLFFLSLSTLICCGSNVALTDTEVYNIADSMTIPLKSEAGAKQDYIMFDVYLSINKKHKDYKTYGSSDTLASYENLIKDAITATVSAHTEDECRGGYGRLKRGDSEVCSGSIPIRLHL